MNPRGKERVLGPYEQPNGWRIIEVASDGERTYTLFATEAKAARYKELLLAEIDKGDHTTATALAAYKKHLEAKGNKPDSVRQTTWAIGMFFTEPIVLQHLSHARCERLYNAMRERPTKTGKPLSVDSHRGILAQVRSFLSWCIERGMLKDNPVAKVKGIGKRRPRGKSLGKDGNELRNKTARAWYEMALFRANKGDQGAIAALVAMLLGMRASEITTRKVGDVDQDEVVGDLLWIPCSKTPAGRRSLEVPTVLAPLLAKLVDGKDPDRYLFQGEDGKPHWRDWIRKNIRRICKLASTPELKVPTVTAHAMRGLLATLAAERGLAGHVIAATLGHEDERTTMTAYASPGSATAGQLRRGHELLEKRLN